MIRVWTAILAALLLLAGCASHPSKSEPHLVGFERLKPGQLPARLSAWHQVAHAAPVLLAAVEGDHLYVMADLGDCSPPEGMPRVAKARALPSHGIWLELTFDGRRAPGEPARLYGRMHLPAVDGAGRNGHTLQEQGMVPYALWGWDSEAAHADGTLLYLPATRYTCRQPLP